MPDQEPDPDATVESGEPVRIWIEDGAGSIVRGVVEVVSENCALVRLMGEVVMTSGHDVAVRLAFDRNSPTLAGAARILWVRTTGDEAECELEWTHSGPERAELARTVISLT
jgi:hypothetical protein